MNKEWRRIGFNLAYGATIGVVTGLTVTKFAIVLTDKLSKALFEADEAKEPDIPTEVQKDIPEETKDKH